VPLPDVRRDPTAASRAGSMHPSPACATKPTRGSPESSQFDGKRPLPNGLIIGKTFNTEWALSCRASTSANFFHPREGNRMGQRWRCQTTGCWAIQLQPLHSSCAQGYYASSIKCTKFLSSWPSDSSSASEPGWRVLVLGNWRCSVNHRPQ